MDRSNVSLRQRETISALEVGDKNVDILVLSCFMPAVLEY